MLARASTYQFVLISRTRWSENLQSSIFNAASASTSWTALSTCLKSCQRIFNLQSRSWIALSADLKNPKGRLSESNCGCALALPAFGQGEKCRRHLYSLVGLRAGQDEGFSNRKSGRSKHMFVDSCIFDLRSRATRSQQMLKTLRFTAFMQITRSMIENTLLSLAWLSSCSVQSTWSSIRTRIRSKLSLIPNSFGHDNSYLQLTFETHKKLQTSKLDFLELERVLNWISFPHLNFNSGYWR